MAEGGCYPILDHVGQGLNPRCAGGRWQGQGQQTQGKEQGTKALVIHWECQKAPEDWQIMINSGAIGKMAKQATLSTAVILLGHGW